MKEYQVKITIPKLNRELEIRVTCTSFSTAASRALREMRKATKGHRLNSVTLCITSMGKKDDEKAGWPTDRDVEEAPYLDELVEPPTPEETVTVKMPDRTVEVPLQAVREVFG